LRINGDRVSLEDVNPETPLLWIPRAMSVNRLSELWSGAILHLMLAN